MDGGAPVVALPLQAGVPIWPDDEAGEEGGCWRRGWPAQRPCVEGRESGKGQRMGIHNKLQCDARRTWQGRVR